MGKSFLPKREREREKNGKRYSRLTSPFDCKKEREEGSPAGTKAMGLDQIESVIIEARARPFWPEVASPSANLNTKFLAKPRSRSFINDSFIVDISVQLPFCAYAHRRESASAEGECECGKLNERRGVRK